MREARMLFRLLKSLTEYEKLMKTLSRPIIDEWDFILNVVNRLSYLFFWILDNIYVLSLMKIIKKDPAKFLKYGSVFWFVALLTKILRNLRKYKLSNNFNERINCVINIFRCLGDSPTAIQNGGIGKKIMQNNVNINEGIMGMGGFISALLKLIQMINRNTHGSYKKTLQN